MWLAVAALIPLIACGRGAPAASRRPSSASLAIARVHLRETTEPELRAALGDPDEWAADGALVYRFTRTPRHETERAEVVTLRFRFDHGKLSKICQARS